MDINTAQTAEQQGIQPSRIILISILIFGVLIVIGIIVSMMWLAGDPKMAAEETLAECLFEDGDPCEEIAEFACWDDMRETVSRTGGRYSTNVIWHNLEDELCCHNSDEVYMQVNVANKAYNVLWFEGTLQYCEAVSPEP